MDIYTIHNTHLVGARRGLSETGVVHDSSPIIFLAVKILISTR